MSGTSTGVFGFVTKEWDALVADAEALWAHESAYFKQFGAWAVGLTHNIMYDLKKAGIETAGYVGGQLKQIFEDARTTVGAVMQAMPKASYTVVIAEALRRMGFMSLLKNLGSGTLAFFAHGFFSMIVSGLVVGTL
jgi:hypothetical protein